MRPHGQCLSELVERQPCSLSPCYSYSASIIDDKVECIRSDGLIVEHGKHPIFYVASLSLCMILEATQEYSLSHSTFQKLLSVLAVSPREPKEAEKGSRALHAAVALR